MKIYYKRLKDVQPPLVTAKGDWFDLYTPKEQDIEIEAGEVKLVHLGIAMKIPKGMEAILAFRSSTGLAYGIGPASGIGVIDQSYSGNNDEWKFPVRAYVRAVIPIDTRIVQFRIQPSQKANIFQKIFWFFSNTVKLVEVSDLGDNNRGGFGSTGK